MSEHIYFKAREVYSPAQATLIDTARWCLESSRTEEFEPKYTHRPTTKLEMIRRVLHGLVSIEKPKDDAFNAIHETRSKEVRVKALDLRSLGESGETLSLRQVITVNLDTNDVQEKLTLLKKRVHADADSLNAPSIWHEETTWQKELLGPLEPEIIPVLQAEIDAAIGTS